MNGLKAFAVSRAILAYAVFTLLILALSACAPIGGIGGDSPDAPDDIWIVPKCMEYPVHSWFLRDSDLTVFGSYGGEVIKIPTDAVDIGVVENPSDPDTVDLVPRGGDYYFSSTGRKIIVVNYEAMSDRYTVQVKNAGESTSPGGNSGGSGSGIEIEWGS